jgi:hypothetical protein
MGKVANLDNYYINVRISLVFQNSILRLNLRKVTVTIKKIVTHVRPHLDEIMGIWMLIKFGEYLFSGIGNAMVEFWDSLPEGKTPGQLEKEGVLLIGIGGGRFDEHPTLNAERKQDVCTTSLVAQALGLADDPALKGLLEFVRVRDLTLSGNAYDLHALIKTFYAAGRDDQMVWGWAFLALSAIYDQSISFFEEAGTDFQAATVTEISIEGKRRKIAVGNSDSMEFAKFARSPHGCRAAVVIQKNSTGQVQVHTTKFLGINLLDTACMLRVEELKKQGKRSPTNFKVLQTDGTIAECPEWHFFQTGQMLLNGSTTKTDTPPTKLSLEEISRLVQIGVNPTIFEPSRETMCKQGKCTSSSRNPCSWYGWGLQRCRKIRFLEAQPQAARQ